ncbi:hypothetical protein [Oryzomonas rubra]|uniref:Uncharacterized protein n=1 Tax=Oryzomonas rubra TaxID=2509454 RepID=A0A5A9X5N0_9BACT|nr:hypothetical protein [Oryzomonas rubra]KAA0888094.1 hypothetical protein ET418_16980 [Oryzomonas rubra]
MKSLILHILFAVMLMPAAAMAGVSTLPIRGELIIVTPIQIEMLQNTMSVRIDRRFGHDTHYADTDQAWISSTPVVAKVVTETGRKMHISNTPLTMVGAAGTAQMKYTCRWGYAPMANRHQGMDCGETIDPIGDFWIYLFPTEVTTDELDLYDSYTNSTNVLINFQ